MFQINKVNEVADNTITINGFTFKVTDDIAERVYNLCVGTPIPVPTVTATTKVANKPVEKPSYYYSDGNVIVALANGKYDLYIETRISKVRYAIKMQAKDCGCAFSGDAKKGVYKWTFSGKDAADKFIAGQKSKAAK